MRVVGEAARDLRAGFDRIRAELDLPTDFPPDVLVAAATAAERAPGSDHVDRLDLPFATLDPASSTDLDQAFAVEQSGADVVLRYAIADVGWFVRHGDPVDVEAWRRGVTVYLPDGRTPLHPPVLSEGAASLLPGVDRPAVVLVVRVGEDGSAVLDGAERAVVRSRAKLAYEHTAPADLPEAVVELARRVSAAEAARGAVRVESIEQEVERSGHDGYVLRFRPRREVEDLNAAMSLAANLAVADALLAAGTGLYRVMEGVDERHMRRLRHTARAFGLDWPASMPLAEYEQSLARDDPRAVAFLLAVRRAGGSARYAVADGDRPWHAAVAATYAHATAPLRRLQDRYVLEAVLAVVAGRPPADHVEAAFAELPDTMNRAERRADAADRAAVDLAEAVVLAGRVGELFDAVVTDVDDRGARIQVCDPAVVGRVDARRVEPGDDVRVRLTTADPASRSIRFERVS